MGARRRELDTSQLARRIADILADKLAEDVVVMDLQGATTFADYFVIASGTSERQIQALADALAETLRDEGVRHIRSEGTAESGWVLLDISGVVVHLFSPERRAYYRLEHLWSGARVVVRIA